MPTLVDLARRMRVQRGSQAFTRLPPLLLMTDAVRVPDPIAAARTLPPGAGIILRHYDHPDRAPLAQRLAAECRQRRIPLLLAGDQHLALAVGAAGLHVPEGMLPTRTHWNGARRRSDWIVTAAAHSPAAIARAAASGVDAVLLAPVFATVSHPAAAPLGVLRFAAMVQASPLPVYALGGISAATAPRLINSGAIGIAGIGAFTERADPQSTV